MVTSRADLGEVFRGQDTHLLCSLTLNHLHAFSGKLPAVVHERRTLAGLTLMHLHRDVAVETEEVIRQFSETNTRRMFSCSVLLE